VTRGAVLIRAGGTLEAPDTCVGAAVSALLTVHNDSTVNLAVDGITLDGDDPMEFGLVQCANPVIPPGGGENFTVRFAPRRVGELRALVNIWNDAPNEDPYTFAVTGIGTVPDINLKQGARNLPSRVSTYDYGNLKVGLTKDVIFTIENTGTAKLIINGLLVGGDGISFRVTVPPAFTVLPGGRANFTLRFAPRSLGGKKASISISSNDPDESPYTVGLTGTGTAN
jgi:hypothetical protein